MLPLQDACMRNVVERVFTDSLMTTVPLMLLRSWVFVTRAAKELADAGDRRSRNRGQRRLTALLLNGSGPDGG